MLKEQDTLSILHSIGEKSKSTSRRNVGVQVDESLLRSETHQSTWCSVNDSVDSLEPMSIDDDKDESQEMRCHQKSATGGSIA